MVRQTPSPGAAGNRFQPDVTAVPSEPGTPGALPAGAAKPLRKDLGSTRGPFNGAAIALYNTSEDVEALIAAVRRIGLNAHGNSR